MSITQRKTKTPITSVIVSPINESVVFGPNNTIIFRISQSDLLYWLVQDSYFTFDVDFSRSAAAAGGGAPNQNMVIRGSGMFIDNVRILHAGNEVYYQQYNIAQQILDYIKSGDNYLNTSLNEWTSHKTYLQSLTDPSNYNLILRSAEWGNNQTITKTGIVLRVSQILKCLSQCENFPLKYVSQQIEIRFQLAYPADFLCAVASVDNNYNFYDIRGNIGNTGAAAGSGGNTNEPLVSNIEGLTYQIKNVRLYMFGEDIDPAYDSLLKVDNEDGKGNLWRYRMPRFNLRNMPHSTIQYYVSNFQCITENTNDMYLWATRNTNLSCMIRPSVTNMNLRFGPYQIPQSPTSDPNYTKPSLYKSMIDDVLEYSTAYYTSSNSDYNASYPVLFGVDSILSPTGHPLRHDTYLMLAGNFTTDDKKLGSNSKQWNSQYNLNYNLIAEEQPWIWVFGVETEYVLALKDGILQSTNL